MDLSLLNNTSGEGASMTFARSFEPDSADVLLIEMYINDFTMSSGMYLEFPATFMLRLSFKALEESLNNFLTTCWVSLVCAFKSLNCSSR
jgi:hypothetical protein